jgi:hypothetical protein
VGNIYHVVNGAAHGVSLVLVLCLSFCTPSEIANFDIASFVQKKVFWLQISMDDTFLVQEVNTEGGLEEIDKCFFFGHFTLLS